MIRNWCSKCNGRGTIRSAGTTGTIVEWEYCNRCNGWGICDKDPETDNRNPPGHVGASAAFRMTPEETRIYIEKTINLPPSGILNV